MTTIDDQIQKIEVYANDGKAEEMESSISKIYPTVKNDERILSELTKTAMLGYRKAATNGLSFLNNSSGYFLNAENPLGKVPEYAKKYGKLCDGGKLSDVLGG
jgi:hypothetical protein